MSILRISFALTSVFAMSETRRPLSLHQSKVRDISACGVDVLPGFLANLGDCTCDSGYMLVYNATSSTGTCVLQNSTSITSGTITTSGPEVFTKDGLKYFYSCPPTATDGTAQYISINSGNISATSCVAKDFSISTCSSWYVSSSAPFYRYCTSGTYTYLSYNPCAANTQFWVPDLEMCISASADESTTVSTIGLAGATMSTDGIFDVLKVKTFPVTSFVAINNFSFTTSCYTYSCYRMGASMPAGICNSTGIAIKNCDTSADPFDTTLKSSSSASAMLLSPLVLTLVILFSF